MILYLDTSALVKRYFSEAHSEKVAEVWNQSADIVTSAVAYAETLAAIFRKKREANLDDVDVAKIVAGFKEDWDSFIRVAAGDNLNEILDQILLRHPLRGFDAIHLASALLVKNRLAEKFLFCCFDNRLSAAAEKEGFEPFPG